MKQENRKKIKMNMPLFFGCLIIGIIFACTPEQKDPKDKAADYSYTQKNQFAKEMQDNAAEVNKIIEELEATAEKAGGDIKTEAARKIQELRLKAEELNKHIDKVKNASDAQWEKVKSDANKKVTDLKNTINNSRTWLSDMVAP